MAHEVSETDQTVLNLPWLSAGGRHLQELRGRLGMTEVPSLDALVQDTNRELALLMRRHQGGLFCHDIVQA